MPTARCLIHPTGGEPDEDRTGLSLALPAPAGGATPWQAVAATAERQHGAISRSQLRSAGLTDRQIDGARRRAMLHPVHRAVFAFGSPRLDSLGRSWAALLACGPDALLGYRSAAAVWCLRPTSSPVTDVVVARTTRPVHAGVRVHCHPALGDGERAVRDGVPVTSVARTLLDLASAVSAHELRRAIAQAEILHLFDLHAIRTLTARHPHHAGRRRLESALTNWSAPATIRSVLESAFVELCARHRLPAPLMNGEILGMEVDAAFPDHGVAVELDGGGTHSGGIRREDDYAKRAALTAAGWSVLAYTYRQVTHDGGSAVLRTLPPVLAGSQRRAGPGGR